METESVKRVSFDLAICPPELRALDPNAEVLWIVFLRKTGIPISSKKTKGKHAGDDLWVDNNSRRAAIIHGFGIPSLAQRLSAAKTELDRARIWWREAAACAEGESIPDLDPRNMAVLNPFIITKELKIKDARFEAIKKSWATDSLPLTDDQKRIQITRKRIKQARAGRNAQKRQSQRPILLSGGASF